MEAKQKEETSGVVRHFSSVSKAAAILLWGALIIVCLIYRDEITVERIVNFTPSEPLAAAAVMLLLGMLGMQGMAGYVFPTYYRMPAAQSAASLAGSIAMLAICAPFAAKFAKKFGKKELSIASCAFGAIAYIVCLIVRPQNAYVYVAFYTLAYIGLGFFNTVILAMITDVIDDAEVKNGVREDGTIYSVYSFARKLGQAATAGLSGALLSMVGYTQATQFDPGVTLGIFRLSRIIPAIGLGLVAVALAFIYPLNKKRVEENSAILAKKQK